jgi:uncharacterized protein YndB with AHSA1/START domain
MTRSFRAPKALVYDACTKAEHLCRWQAPYKYKIENCEVDAKVGGLWKMTQTDPEGAAYFFHGEFLELTPPDRIVSTFACEGFPGVMRQTLEFAEADGVTTITVFAEFDSKEERDAMVDSGMEWGAGQSYDRLETQLMFEHDDPRYPRFAITREFAAPKELVWKAWTEAERLQKWWGPKGCSIRVAKLDLAPGGIFHYGMEWEGHGVMWGRFIYRAIDPTDRLEFVNSFSDETGGVTRAPFSANWPLEVLNVLTLTENDGKTVVHLEGGPITGSAAELDQFCGFFESLNQGFGGTFDQLADYLANA